MAVLPNDPLYNPLETIIMAKKITELNPQALWKHFAAICNIPHPSGHVEGVANYLMEVGKSLGLETVHDKAGNVIIRKPATAGMESRIGVILQGHMDMVPQANKAVNHNFEIDPIQPRVDGEWVTATDTTLGADNGIGVSAILAVLEATDLPHGAIEALFTRDEETGMYGAKELQPDELTGKILLNMDSETDGELYMSCAGGLDVEATFRYQEKETLHLEDYVAYKVSLGGLLGGHSGIDINLGRLNANKAMFRFLKIAVGCHSVRVASYAGGTLRNAIPREAETVVVVPKVREKKFLAFVKDFEATLKHEYGYIETGLSFAAKESEMPEKLMPEPAQDDLINAIVACHNGVYRMIPDVPEVVETSSNLSIVTANAGVAEVKILVRSSSETQKYTLASELESTFSLAGAKVVFDGAYPGWEPNLQSAILQTMRPLYPAMFGREAKVKMMHAGLECGIIGAAYPGLDMISFGPTIEHPHSPQERVNIKSVENFWKVICTTLEHIPAENDK